MLANQEKITIEELKTYLYSLDNERLKAEERKINIYKERCKEKAKRMKLKEMQKIKALVNKEYESQIEAKKEILKLLEEYSAIPSKMEKLEVTKYMLYRADVRSAEDVLIKTTKRIEKRYNDIVEAIEEVIKKFSIFDNIQKIDLSVYESNGELLKSTKENYKLEYTKEEKKALIQNELDIIEKVKIFNTMPIPHEILKNSDKEIQSKMPKFNNVRQKRLRILSAIEADYEKMQTPKEINAMIDDALINLETINDILTKSEYAKIKNGLIRKRKRIYKSINELRGIIKSKEKKAGVTNYNIQDARYERMEALRNIITEANTIINAYIIPGAEEQLAKLKAAYEREKQFAAVIEKLQKEAGNDVSQNLEVQALEEQISSLENRIDNSNNIIKDQKEKIEKAKKELVVLWKMEIDTTIAKKKETLELPETTNEKAGKGFLTKLKKLQEAKRASYV